MLSERLIKLYNTLCLIDTKGENTKIMAQCLAYLEGLTVEVKNEENKLGQAPKKPEEEGETK